MMTDEQALDAVRDRIASLPAWQAAVGASTDSDAATRTAVAAARIDKHGGEDAWADTLPAFPRIVLKAPRRSGSRSGNGLAFARSLAPMATLWMVVDGSRPKPEESAAVLALYGQIEAGLFGLVKEIRKAGAYILTRIERLGHPRSLTHKPSKQALVQVNFEVELSSVH